MADWQLAVFLGGCFLMAIGFPCARALWERYDDARFLRAPMIDGVPLPSVDDPRWTGSGAHRLGPFEVDEFSISVAGKIIGRRLCYWQALQDRANAREMARLERIATAGLLGEDPPRG